VWRCLPPTADPSLLTVFCRLAFSFLLLRARQATTPTKALPMNAIEMGPGTLWQATLLPRDNPG
jgi:hypothetical protein